MLGGWIFTLRGWWVIRLRWLVLLGPRRHLEGWVDLFGRKGPGFIVVRLDVGCTFAEGFCLRSYRFSKFCEASYCTLSILGDSGAHHNRAC